MVLYYKYKVGKRNWEKNPEKSLSQLFAERGYFEHVNLSLNTHTVHYVFFSEGIIDRMQQLLLGFGYKSVYYQS